MWAVETFTLLDGFVNTWTTGDDENPVVYESKDEAEQALTEYLEDQHAAVDAGDMADKYPRSDFRIVDISKEVAKKLAAIERRENEEAWREQAPELGIHPDMHVKKSEREALGFFEEDRFV